MYGMWWKEVCDLSLGVGCPPEQTCAGTGDPIDESSGESWFTYFDSGYTFDGAGCYYDSDTYPAFAGYSRDVYGSSANLVDKMIRIRRLWQFPSYSPTNPLPDDVYNREV